MISKLIDCTDDEWTLLLTSFCVNFRKYQIGGYLEDECE